MSADSKATTAATPSLANRPKLDAPTRELIREKAKQLVHRPEFNRSDLDDMEQDLTIHVWQRLGRFKQGKADHAAFVRMLLAHAACTILRGRNRQAKRAPRPLAWALHKAGNSPPEPIDRVSSRREEDTALALDVDAVLATLPWNLRRVAEALRLHSITAAARHLGLSHTAVYRRLEHLRQAFAKAGLEQFCEKERTPRKRAE